MMDPKSEALDLAARPLPPVEIPEPLALYMNLDVQIALLEEQLKTLRENRDAAMKYAIEHGIETDGRYRLAHLEKTRTTRQLDIVKFKEKFPKEFEMIKDIQRNSIQNELEHVGEKILLKEVDAVVKKAALEESGAVTVLTKVEMQYTVVPK